jgi:hypothetical protein
MQFGLRRRHLAARRAGEGHPEPALSKPIGRRASYGLAAHRVTMFSTDGALATTKDFPVKRGGGFGS